MAKTILTPHQLNFLQLAQKEPSITKRFYLTGGTALAEFYLKHRESHDLDLFCEKEEVDPKIIEAFLKKFSPQLKITQIKPSQFLGLISYQLIYQDKNKLKVDFNYYPFPRIEKGIKFGNLQVDSIRDIAVNKIHTLFMKPRLRDYLDIYFVMIQKKYSLNRLILDAKAKFDWDIDRPTLGSQFLRIKDFAQREFPKMLVPFNRKEMEKFFLNLAKSLEKEIFK